MIEKIAIIGAGNMGQAIAGSLLDKKIATKNQLFLTNSKTNNNNKAIQKADVIILAVKPQMATRILEEIKEVVQGKLIVSIMAGITISTIQQALEKKIAIVRVMPNLAAKVGKSISVWVKSKEVTESHKVFAKTILNAIGMELELQKENQIDMATAISGSGPAYFFYITELLENGAIKLGFSQEEARLLIKQTLLGSAELLRTSTHSAKELRHAVTSKGGTTEAALEIFQKVKLDDIIIKGIFAAFQRARKLGGEKK